MTAIWLFSALFSLPRFFEVELTNGSFGKTSLLQNKTYTIIYRIACYFLIMYLAPMVSITILNSRLLCALRKSRKLREHIANGSKRLTNGRRSGSGGSKSEHRSVTTVVVSVAIVFFTCNLLAMMSQLIWSIHQCFQGDLAYLDYYRRYMAHVSNVMVTLNSTVNFVIYCVFSKKFRDKFCSIYCCCVVTRSLRHSAGGSTYTSCQNQHSRRSRTSSYSFSMGRDQ